MPDASGKRMSSTMADGVASAAMRKPSAPVEADMTPNPRSSRCMERSSRIDRSSSTIRIRSMGRSGGEGHRNNISAARALIDADVTAVLAGNPRHDGEPESAASRPLRRERHEGFLPNLRRKGTPGIADGKLPSFADFPRSDLHGAASGLLGGDGRLTTEDLHRRPHADRVEGLGTHAVGKLPRKRHAPR